MDGAALDAVALSIAGLVLLIVLTPVVMGSTIALAVSIAGEELDKTAPDNATGFKYLTPFGSCATPSSPTSSPWVLQTGTIGINNKSWVMMGQPSNTPSCDTGSTGPYPIVIPAGVLVSEGTISRFVVEITSTNYCSNELLCDNGWSFDWTLKINGTTVMSQTDARSESIYFQQTGIPSTSHHHEYLKIDYALDAFDSLNLEAEMHECGANNTAAGACNATLTLSNVEVVGSYTTYQGEPFTANARIRIETYSTQADTSAFTLRLSAWLLFAAYSFLAVASTPLFNPLTKLRPAGVE